MDRQPQRGRLALRLTLSFLIPALLGLVAVGVLADFAAQQAFERQLSERLMAIANAERAMLSGYFTELVERVDGQDDRSLNNLRKRISPIAEQTGVRRVFIIRPDLTSVVDTNEGVSYGQPLYELEPDAAELEAVFEGESRASVLYYAEDGTPYKYAYAPLFHPETDELVGVVGVEGSSSQVGELAELRINTVALGSIAVLLLVATSIWVSRRLTSAVDRLVSASERIGQGKLDIEVPQTRSDELGILEQALDQMRRDLRDREEEMQMMLSGIAHEVRNPLGGIELFLGLLREDLEGTDEADPEQLEHVRKMNRELEYLGRVVQEFLDFARRSRLELIRFSARDLAEELQTAMSGDLMKADVALELKIEDGIELTADRDRLKRVLVNLVRNAVQASGSGDTVKLEVTADNDDSRRIAVADEGAGIPDEKLEDIFRPFYTSREKGTGLGLPMSRKIAEAHGGSITVESTVGEGTRITLTLPFDETIEEERSVVDIPDGWLG